MKTEPAIVVKLWGRRSPDDALSYKIHTARQLIEDACWTWTEQDEAAIKCCNVLIRAISQNAKTVRDLSPDRVKLLALDGFETIEEFAECEPFFVDFPVDVDIIQAFRDALDLVVYAFEIMSY